MDELSKAVEMLLTITRDEIADHNPHQALAALLHAVRLTRGESAIFDVLDEAKRRCSATLDARSVEQNYEQARRISMMLMEQDTILSERGEETILKDAFEDGSSLLCTRCGGLVAKVRWESHSQFWCSSLGGGDEGEMIE